MSRKKIRALQSVTVPTTIPVLVPAKPEDSEGVTYTYATPSQYLRGEQVRVLGEQELTTKRHLAKVASDNPGWLDFICGVKDLQNLRGAAYDPLLHARGWKGVEIWKKIAPTLALDPKEPAPEELGSFLLPALAVALAGVRLTFWYTKRDDDGNQQLLPGLYCPDLKTATAAGWLLGLDIRVCPNCAKLFLAKRPKQMACSIECRETYRVARWRARKRFKEVAA